MTVIREEPTVLLVNCMMTARIAQTASGGAP